MDKDKLTLAITKALAYTENGGKPSSPKAGKSGELKSIFQFLPATWKAYSKEVTGHDIPLSPEAEIYVVHQKVADWVDKGLSEGKSADQIASEVGSEWNSGNPNAYKENHEGINKYGVKYDTPKYAKTVTNYMNEFIKDPSLGIAPKVAQNKSSGMMPQNSVSPAIATASPAPITFPGMINSQKNTTVFG